MYSIHTAFVTNTRTVTTATITASKTKPPVAFHRQFISLPCWKQLLVWGRELQQQQKWKRQATEDCTYILMKTSVRGEIHISIKKNCRSYLKTINRTLFWYQLFCEVSKQYKSKIGKKSIFVLFHKKKSEVWWNFVQKI